MWHMHPSQVQYFDHEIISKVILLPSADSRRVVQLQAKVHMYTKQWLTACLVKLAQQWMTISKWL